MGMYDSLKIDINMLPISNLEKHTIGDIEWQTKCLDCDLSTIYITDDGLLKIDKFKDIKYNGILDFYSDVGNDWYVFYAKFYGGKLVEITGGKQI